MGSDCRKISADKKMEIVLVGLEVDNVAEFYR